MKKPIALLTLVGLVGLALIPAFADPPADGLFPPGVARQPTEEAGQQKIIARWTDSEPALDGVKGPGEWSAAIPFPVTFAQPDRTPGLERIFSVPENPNDLSYTIYAMYDAENLYLALDVADGDLWADSGALVWWDDDVEVFIDGDRVNICPHGDWAWVCDVFPDLCDRCATDAVGTNDFMDWEGPDPSIGGEEGFQLLTSVGEARMLSPGGGPIDWWSEVEFRPRGYLMEYRIALESIDTADGPADVPPGPGAEIGFTVVVGDDDNGGPGYEEGDSFGIWDGWFAYWAEDYWGTLYFQPPHAKPVAQPVESTTWGTIKEQIE